MTCNIHWRDVFVETDYAFTFTCNLKGNVQRHLIFRIRKLIRHDWNVVFKQISREVNSVVHSLTDMMKKASFDTQIFHNVPSSINHL